MIAAEELLANNIDGLRDALEDDDLYYFYRGVICEFAKAFAKLHVEVALKQASENAHGAHCTDYIDKDSILNSYNLDNIK